MRPGSLRGHLGTPALRSVDGAVLDAVDAPGRITYYTADERRGPVLRRRVLRTGTHDEAFGRESLRWEPAGPLPGPREKAAEYGLVRLDEVEAADLIAAAMTAAGR
ncbi:hypothetical protein ACFV2Q_08410 [Streptomyces sp. NPDC059650]|uniref:hypothetical protein n=1 Tax=Streptomyces sp. NPDC059650 TaxID=3346896 RepID=UPI00368168DF